MRPKATISPLKAGDESTPTYRFPTGWGCIHSKRPAFLLKSWRCPRTISFITLFRSKWNDTCHATWRGRVPLLNHSWGPHAPNFIFRKRWNKPLGPGISSEPWTCKGVGKWVFFRIIWEETVDLGYSTWQTGEIVHQICFSVQIQGVCLWQDWRWIKITQWCSY